MWETIKKVIEKLLSIIPSLKDISKLQQFSKRKRLEVLDHFFITISAMLIFIWAFVQAFYLMSPVYSAAVFGEAILIVLASLVLCYIITSILPKHFR